jgi:hypothetical protein
MPNTPAEPTVALAKPRIQSGIVDKSATGVDRGGRARRVARPRHNSEVDWNKFDPDEYYGDNYAKLRPDDRHIIELVRDFFAKADVSDGHGVDVGAGPNLYPAMSMLPFARRIDLWDYSWANVTWLKGELNGLHEGWRDFWEVYRYNDAYLGMPDLDKAFARVASVKQGSVFDLPEGQWSLGTMFFVACSLSTHLDEFARAVHHFVRSLRPQAPFATAFMQGSTGYPVGAQFFPAVNIDENDVRACLEVVAYNPDVIVIDADPPFDDGRKMIVATGRARG